MSYDPRLAARPYGVPDDDYDSGARKGSVRAARERLQAARVQDQLPDRSRIRGLPSRPNQLVSQYSFQNRAEERDEELTPPARRGNGNLLSPTPQWPLPNDADEILDSRSAPRSPNRGPPPQRPPRPVSDELPIQQPTSPNYLQPQSPSFLQPPSPNYRGSSYSDDMFSPTSARSSRPLTTSSAASEASSLGEIPDFPVPQPPMPTVQPLPRRNPTLGPPPSSRRGPSSYYTQMSYVSPITEESETQSDIIRSHHGSFASSNVFPINAGDYYLDDDGMRSDDGDTITSDRGMGSRASDHDDQSGLVQQPALVRQASLGRRTKPSLMTIKSVDSFGEKKGAGKANSKPKAPAVGAAGISSAILAARDGIGGRGSPGPPSSSLSNGTGLLDESSSSRSSLDEKSSPEDPEKAEFALYAGPGKTSFGDRVGKRRPPRIDVDAVREAEARGSLTSLPELIRRATRLAANLDRGKTASRLGLDFWEAGAPEKGVRKSGSLSDMLAAFPPPGEATPARSNTPNANRMSKWPSSGTRAGVTDSAMSDNKSKRRRRCCGMPMWTFVTLLIVLLFLIAAAVIIPIVLIVLPRMRDTRDAAQSNNGNGSSTGTGDNNTSPPTAVPTSGGQNNQCSGVITCQNDGVAIFNSDRSCNCVCINGFTGRTCGTAGDAGCTTTNIPGTANNATMGSGIPRLLQSATDDFNVPLDSQRLLSLFSTEALSCTAENALITFNGLASRSVRSQYIPIIVEKSVEPSKTLPHPDLEQRQAIGAPGDATNQNNQNKAATTSAAAEPTSTQPISSDVNALDYARIGVLFAFQETGELDVAARAQQSIQTFLTNERQGNTNSKTVNVGPFTMDLANFTIRFQNGTTISGRDGS